MGFGVWIVLFMCILFVLDCVLGFRGEDKFFCLFYGVFRLGFRFLYFFWVLIGEVELGGSLVRFFFFILLVGRVFFYIVFKKCYFGGEI